MLAGVELSGLQETLHDRPGNPEPPGTTITPSASAFPWMVTHPSTGLAQHCLTTDPAEICSQECWEVCLIIISEVQKLGVRKALLKHPPTLIRVGVQRSFELSGQEMEGELQCFPPPLVFKRSLPGSLSVVFCWLSSS